MQGITHYRLIFGCPRIEGRATGHGTLHRFQEDLAFRELEDPVRLVDIRAPTNGSANLTKADALAYSLLPDELMKMA
ncbi:MAG: hypothetical protein EBY11_12255 [Proteobacteria bacterium]|nr:hypothetical protein [Pseudomonadota bacterium]